MLFFHRVVHMWGQPPARGAEGRCRAAAGLWTTRSGPAVGEEVHSLCVHALPQAVTGVGKQVFHRPRGPVRAGIPPVDQDLPHVPNPVDNQGREGWLSTGGCGQLWGGGGEGAWGQSWGQSGDNLGGRFRTAPGWWPTGYRLTTVAFLVPYRAGVVAHAGAWLPWVFRAAPRRAAPGRCGGAAVRGGAAPPRRRCPARSGGGGSRPYGWLGARGWSSPRQRSRGRTGVDTGDTGHAQPGAARGRTGGSPGLCAPVARPAPDRTCSGSHRGRVGGV